MMLCSFELGTKYAIVSASHKKELIFLIRVFHFDGDKNAHAFRIKAIANTS